MQINKFDEALREYKKVTELTPQNYRGWLGRIEAYTHRLTLRITSQDVLQKLQDLLNSLKVFAPPEQCERISAPISSYIASETAKNQSERVALEQRIEQNCRTLYDLHGREKNMSDSLVIMVKDHQTLESKYTYNLNKMRQAIRVIRIILIVGGVFGLMVSVGGTGSIFISMLCIVLGVFLIVWKPGPNKNTALNMAQENEAKKQLDSVRSEIFRLENAIAEDQNKLQKYT